MIRIRFRPTMIAVIIIAFAAASPSRPKDAAPTTLFRDCVDMKAFMEHVLGPAVAIIWKVNAVVIDENGEHDLSPKSDKDWEQIVSGAATLAEATNALMIPQRVRDRSWIPYVRKLADAADKAYRAARAHDLKSISEVSDELDGICAACHHHYGLESVPTAAQLLHILARPVNRRLNLSNAGTFVVCETGRQQGSGP